MLCTSKAAKLHGSCALGAYRCSSWTANLAMATGLAVRG